jgi:hypothetical protein
MMVLTFHDKKETDSVQMNREEGDWLIETLNKISVSYTKLFTLQEIKSDFESHFENFELFWFSKPVVILRTYGLLII